MPLTVGIDLGTTFSCVAAFVNDDVQILTNETGGRTMPSYVAFADREILIGEAAKNQAGTNPKNTIFDAKRLLGRTYSDKHLQEDIPHWPFEVINVRGKPKLSIQHKGENKILNPEEISGFVLGRLKEIAQDYFGKPVDGAVITVPAYFNDAQRQATKDAGEIAGLKVLRIINEPTAAAIAYGFQNVKTTEQRNILVFDLGGGTLDVTILAIDDGIYEVLATSGDTHLGGEDFDNRLIVDCIRDIQARFKYDITTDKKALARLRTACEKAKKTLSSVTETTINVDGLFNSKDYQKRISRKHFEDVNQELFLKIEQPIRVALEETKMLPSQIQDIILVGGSTHIPRIQEILKNIFKANLCKNINPDEAIAFGAAMQAAKLGGGEESEGLTEMVLLDVTPLSLGVEVVGGVMSVIIPRNTTVPVTKNRTFNTHKDNQSCVHVIVFEGERPLTKENNRLGDFRLTGLSQSKAGQNEIDVEFTVDSNGILNVKAVERNGKKENTIKITSDGSRHSREQIEEMIKRAEEFRLEDDREKQRIHARVTLENLCLRFQSEFRSAKAKGRLEGSKREEMFTKLAETLSWIDSNEKAEKGAYETVLKEIHDFCDPVRRRLYEKTSQCCEEEENDFATFMDVD